MPIDQQEFRRVLSHFAAGVTVVTTCAADGAPYGLTATAFTSVSLEPPLVLVCVDKRAESHPHFHDSKVFAVNFLGEGHEELSRRFATSGGDKFTDCEFRRGVTGAPLLADESVIPAEAGIQSFQAVLDPRFRGGDGNRPFSTDCQPLAPSPLR